MNIVKDILPNFNISVLLLKIEVLKMHFVFAINYDYVWSCNAHWARWIAVSSVLFSKIINFKIYYFSNI